MKLIHAIFGSSFTLLGFSAGILALMAYHLADGAHWSWWLIAIPVSCLLAFVGLMALALTIDGIVSVMPRRWTRRLR